jgi:hypothetical protein
MLISGLHHSREDGEEVLSAKIAWEDNDRPDGEYFFRTAAPDVSLDVPNYNAFLAGTVAPALRWGERRIKIDGPVCPRLADNLKTAAGYLSTWFWYKYGFNKAGHHDFTVEASFLEEVEDRPARTGSFFSGGIDSLFALQHNRETIPKQHPASIRDIIFVHGFDMGTRGHWGDWGNELGFFNDMVASFRPLAEETGVRLIPMRTNIRVLDNAVDGWLEDYMGLAMASVAHSLSRELTDVLVPSSYDIATLHPCASNPAIEPNASSATLRIHHENVRFTRLEKVASVAKWPSGLGALRVCFGGKPGVPNCGECTKCFRTMLELVCSGNLEDAVTFPKTDITPTMVSERLRPTYESLPFLGEIAAQLEAAGRKDLARAVMREKRLFTLKTLVDVKRIARDVDERMLSGRLKRLIKSPKAAA